MSPSLTGTRATWIAAALVAVCVALVFQPILDAEFLNFDDDLNITENYAFRGLDGEHLRWMFTTSWMGPYQPLSWLSLAVDHALWGLGGPREFPQAPLYHRTNVLLHALTAAAFVFLTRALLLRAGARRDTRHLLWAAAGAALFFGLHPLRVESVAWVTERRDVLSGLFFVLALVAWLRRTEESGRAPVPTRSWGAAAAALVALVAFWSSVDRTGPSALAWGGTGAPGLGMCCAALALSAYLAAGNLRRGAYFLSLALFLAALLSKGLVVVLPLLLLVLDGWPLRRLTRASLLGCVLEKAPFLALSVAFGQLAFWGQKTQAGTVVGLADHGLGERLAQVAYGLVHYPLVTLVPRGLRPIYELPETLSFAEPRFALSAVGVVLAVLVLWSTRHRTPALLAASIAFALTAAPVLGLTQSGPQLVADRYTYLACMPFALLVGGGLLSLLQRGSSAGRLALASALLALVGYGGATWRYAHAWRNSESLWAYALALEPENGAALLNRATAHARRAERERDPGRRRALLLETLEFLDGGFKVRRDPRFLGNMARIHALLGDSERALAFSERALELARADGGLVANYYLSYGIDLLGVGRADAALAALEVVLEADPANYRGLMTAGRALTALGRHPEAARRFEQAARLEAGNLPAWRRVALAREAAGDHAGALRAWRRVLALDPGHAGAREHLSEQVESGR